MLLLGRHAQGVIGHRDAARGHLRTCSRNFGRVVLDSGEGCCNMAGFTRDAVENASQLNRMVFSH